MTRPGTYLAHAIVHLNLALLWLSVPMVWSLARGRWGPALVSAGVAAGWAARPTATEKLRASDWGAASMWITAASKGQGDWGV